MDFVIFRITLWKSLIVKETSQNWMARHSRKENKWKETFSVYRRSIFTRTTPVKKYLGRELLRWPDSIFSPTSQAISKKFVSWSPKTFLRRDGTKMALRIFPPWRNVFFSFPDLDENIIKCIQGKNKERPRNKKTYNYSHSSSRPIPQHFRSKWIDD